MYAALSLLVDITSVKAIRRKTKIMALADWGKPLSASFYRAFYRAAALSTREKIMKWRDAANQWAAAPAANSVFIVGGIKVGDTV